MKPYAFRLEVVLKTRRIEAAMERQRVAMLVREATRAASDVARLAKECEANLFSVDDLDAPQFIARIEQQARLADMLAQAYATHDAFTALLASERQVAAAAERHVAVLERLDARRRNEWIVNSWREDTKLLDENSNARTATRMLEASHDN